MQNLDKITDKITADARLRAEKIMLDADAVCDEIMKNAEERADALLEETKKRAEREALAAAERAYSTADMKKKEMLLATRVGLISKVFREAHRQLLELDEDKYCIFAAHLLADAAVERIEAVNRLKEMYGDSEDYSSDFEVLFRKEDLETRAPVIIKTAKAFMRKKSAALGKTPFAVSEEIADIDGGVILRYGDIETNCSFEAVIKDAKQRLESRVDKILFSADEDGTAAENDSDTDNEE